MRGAGAATAEANNKDRRKKLNQALTKIDDQQKQIKKKKRLTLEQRIERAGMSFKEKHFYIGAAICAVTLTVIGFLGGLAIWQVGLMGVVRGVWSTELVSRISNKTPPEKIRK